MKQRVLFLLCALTANATLLSLNITTAQQHAQSNRPLIKAHEQSVHGSKHRQSQTLAAYLPQLSTSHVSTFSQEHSTVNSSTHTLSLHGRQLIFSPNGPQLDHKIAQKATEQSRQILAGASHRVRHDTIHAFLDAWLMQEKKQSIDYLKNYIIHQRAQINAEHMSGIKSTPDSLIAQATIAAHEATVSTYFHELQSARAKLRTMLGRNDYRGMTTLSFTPQAPQALDRLSQYLAMAYAYRPELKAKNAAAEQHRLNAQSHRLSYLPSVHLQGSVGRTFSGTAPDRGTNASIGITASWQFFDGFARRHAAHAADAEQLRTQFEYQELRNTIMHEVTSAYHSLQAAVSALQAALAQTRAQEQQYRKNTLALSLGASTPASGAQQSYQLSHAIFTLTEKYVAVRKKQETLAYYCGYSPQLRLTKDVVHEL